MIGFQTHIKFEVSVSESGEMIPSRVVWQILRWQQGRCAFGIAHLSNFDMSYDNYDDDDWCSF